jgi:hypothetical protein
MRSLCLAVLAIFALSTPAGAQPARVFGKPLPSPELPVGTVRVRVVAGDVTRPVRGAKVVLDTGTERREATTDDAGIAAFAGVPAGATAHVSVTGEAGAPSTSQPLPIPRDGGTRVMLSTKPVVEGELPRVPSRIVPDADLAAGTIVVGGAPAAAFSVVLVGYAADGGVHVTSRAIDARHRATFDHLDTSGATAYFALALVSRGRVVDRLETAPATLTPGSGARAELRPGRTGDGAIDELPELDGQEPVPAGTVRVKLAGAPGPAASVALFDATTGKVIARAASVADHADLRVRTAPGHVLYAEATQQGRTYRSLPFQPIAAHGTLTSVYVLPRLIASYKVFARPAGSSLLVQAQVALANNAWSPYVVEHDLPLPRGFARAQLADGNELDARLAATGLHVASAVPPGTWTIDVSFELPATAGKVAWSLDLPYGSWQSTVEVADEPGVALEPPAGAGIAPVAAGGYLTLEKITIMPGQSLDFSVELPRLPPKLEAIAHACTELVPDTSPLVGKPAPALVARQLDGRPLSVSALRGHVAVVTFMASWDMLSGKERPQLAALGKAVRGVIPVLVFSDKDAGVVRGAIDPAAPYRVVLDPPATGNIGPITLAWGTKLLPESYLVDRAGRVRYYFANARDWSSPDAIACVKALAAD